MKAPGIIPAYLLLLLLLMQTLPASAFAAELGEYEIKSGMLFNFINYIDWPADYLPKNGALELCIAGDTPANRSFIRLQNKEVKGHRIMVRQLQNPSAAAGCNLLFIHGSEHRYLTAYLQIAQKRSIVTVSDSDGFASNNGMIGFIEQDGKIRFEINIEATHQARIKINSQLLKLARIVAGHK